MIGKPTSRGSHCSCQRSVHFSFLEGAGVFNFASIGPEPAGGIPETGANVYPFFKLSAKFQYSVRF